jgi:D-lactate dehydrogenase (cytochrome)
MASTSGSGLSTLKYGTTRENIISLLVVTPTGKLVRTRREVRKSSTGYDLTNLYIGAEGTLGIIVELTLKIHPKLKYVCGASLEFDTVLNAALTVTEIKRMNLSMPSLCRFLHSQA